MTLRIQNACGHGGTRLKHILVCAAHELCPPVPLWQRALLALVLIGVALCLSRLNMPGVPVWQRTIMDVSRLDVKNPPAQPKKMAPVEKPTAAPQPGSRTVYSLTVKPPRYQSPVREGAQASQPDRPGARSRHEVPYPAQESRPAIARSHGYQSGSEVNLYPAVARERKAAEGGEAWGDDGGAAAPAAKLRRDGAAEGGAVINPSAKSTYIYRVRGGPGATPVPSVAEPIALPQRPSRAAEVGGNAQAPRVAALRSAAAVSIDEPKSPAVPPSPRQRSKNPGSAAAGSGVALARGVSLMSLKICDSALQQEEAIKAVLSVVGSRQSCTSDKGEFRFKETKRVSSFNLIIFPSGGREPSQRCEELDYAYHCLKTN